MARTVAVKVVPLRAAAVDPALAALHRHLDRCALAASTTKGSRRSAPRSR